MLSLTKIEQQALHQADKLAFALRRRALRFLKNPSTDFIEMFDVQLANLLAEQQALMHVTAVNNAMQKVIKFNRNLERQTGLKVKDVKEKYLPEALRIAQQTSSNINQSLRDKISSGVLKSKSNSQIVSEIEKSFNKLGVTGFTEGQIRSLVTTNLLVAKSAGEWNTYATMQDVLWGFKYVTAGDDRVRPAHEAMDGVTLPFSDLFWKTNYPPNGYNCRCEVIPLFSPERQKRSDAEPDQGFSFNPGEGYRTLVPGDITKPVKEKKQPVRSLTPVQQQRVQDLGTSSRPVKYEPVVDRAISRSRQTSSRTAYAAIDATDFNVKSFKPGGTLVLNKHVIAKNKPITDATTVIRVQIKSGDVGLTVDANTILLSGKRQYKISGITKRNGVNIITVVQQ